MLPVMSAVASYAYAGSSVLGPDGGLLLRTSGGRTAAGPASHPQFFQGLLTTPEPAALGLLAVAEVARTRYFQPLNRAFLDPVVTGSTDRLRFESFSGCCGVYARLDVLAAGLDGQMVAHGTTNVDVNPPLREALARVGGRDPLRLAVGTDGLAVTTLDGPVVERKVPLPVRWLRGFAEVQAIVSGFDARLECTGGQATSFLRGLRPGHDRTVVWVVQAGPALRLTSRPVPGAVCLAGPGRLAALRPLLRLATELRAYGPPVGPATTSASSTWELCTPALRLTLTLSPEPRRGFSGEGAVLAALATDDVSDDADLVAALLSFDPAIDIASLAEQSGLPAARVRVALTQLGMAGQVGYDVAEASYFHRILPYDAAAVARLNPRLIGARQLVESGAVAIGPDHAWVRSGDARYQVRLDGTSIRSCTCPWWATHRGDRGPCKHALAVGLVLGTGEPPPATVGE
jgi:hypothetical protein